MSVTTETEERIDCPVLAEHCTYYLYQCDSNGEVAICYCSHPQNKNEYEGNCAALLCPCLVY